MKKDKQIKLPTEYSSEEYQWRIDDLLAIVCFVGFVIVMAVILCG